MTKYHTSLRPPAFTMSFWGCTPTERFSTKNWEHTEGNSKHFRNQEENLILTDYSTPKPNSTVEREKASFISRGILSLCFQFPTVFHNSIISKRPCLKNLSDWPPSLPVNKYYPCIYGTHIFNK